jgi:Spy/CpxP family protein refolding chaperone
MRHWERPLLIFSLALNAAFVSLAAVHHVARPDTAELPRVAREPSGDRRGPRQWRDHRRAVLGRELRMNHEQLRHLDAGFDAVRPELRSARQQVSLERRAYQEALVRGDAPAARAAVTDLSRAQTRVDSLCAEAMLRETAELRPEQRAHYVRWTFRPGPGRFSERTWK